MLVAERTVVRVVVSSGDGPDPVGEGLIGDVLAALALAGDVLETLQSCSEAVVDRFDAAFARIWVLNEADQILELRASAGLYTHLDGPHGRVPVGSLKIGRIAASRRAHLTNDVLHDPQISDPQWARREGMVAFAGYPLLARGRLVGVLALFARQPLSEETLEVLAKVADAIGTEIERSRVQQRLRSEHGVLTHLQRVAVTLSSAQFDLRRVVQTVTDAATELSGAEFGAFFYNVIGDDGEAFMLYTLSGAPAEAFDGFGLPRNTAIFDPTFRGLGTVRIGDVTRDPRYGQMAPHHGMPSGHLPVRSYLAVPVTATDGEVIGGLFFAHSTPGVFTELSEAAVEAVAGHAAVAIENARLYQRERNVALTLQHSLLPDALPELPGVSLAARYQPAVGEVEVGGDWYDAMLLPDGRLGISVGDVVGHDIRAAGVMGQLRTAVRAIMLDGAEPADVVVRLERFMKASDLEEFTTFVLGLFNPADRSMALFCAGHPAPVLLHAGGHAELLGAGRVCPLGIGGTFDIEEMRSAVTVTTVPPGSTIVLYTDGLIERRNASLDEGEEKLLGVLNSLAGLSAAEVCEQTIQAMDGAVDDVVIMAMHVT